MDIIVSILGVLMSVILGYLINELRHIKKKERELAKMKTPGRDFIKYFKENLVTPQPDRTMIDVWGDYLKIAIKNENYEHAAKLRDRIKKLKTNKNK
jgi:protein-arginine kinase activator protein McsA